MWRSALDEYQKMSLFLLSTKGKSGFIGLHRDDGQTRGKVVKAVNLKIYYKKPSEALVSKSDPHRSIKGTKYVTSGW
jgi:hypothetical protein